MGLKCSKPTSCDGRWASVAKFQENNSVFETENQIPTWGNIDPDLFKGFTDQDMREITKIMVAKKSCPTNDCKKYEMGGCWVVNHDIIRIIEIEWDQKKRGYNYTCSIKAVDEIEQSKKYPEKKTKYPTENMSRLAININGLEDYKDMKDNESKGEIFNKIAKELEPYHKSLE